MKPHKEIILHINETLAQVSKILDKKVQTVKMQTQETDLDLNSIHDPDEISNISAQREMASANDSEELLQKYFLDFEASSLKTITELVSWFKQVV